MRYRGISIGEGIRENIRGNVPEENSKTLGWRILRVRGGEYILKAHSTQTVFGFQQRTNMETNKGDNWLEAIAISNYKAM
jgi:hypothetical protein